MQLLFPGVTPQQTMSLRSGGWEQGVGQARTREEQTPSEKAHTTFQWSLLSVCELDPSPITGRFWSDGGDSQSVQSAPFQGQKTKNSPGSGTWCLCGTRKQRPLSLFTHSSSPQLPHRDACRPPTVFESLQSSLWEINNPREVSFEVPIS